MSTENKMEPLVDKMVQHICDNLCVFPHTESDQERLEEKCAECEMGDYICSILNLHNESLCAAGNTRQAIREKSEKLEKAIEHAIGAKERLSVIDSYYVDGRLKEMVSFKAWLDNLVPPDKPKQLPEEFKNHIKDRFERTK